MGRYSPGGTMSDDLSEIRDNAELGVIAYGDAEELASKVRASAEAIGLLTDMIDDLVGRLPESERSEYMDDLAKVRDLQRFL